MSPQTGSLLDITDVARERAVQNGSAARSAREQRAVRLACLGLGWIGLNRLKSIADHPNVEVAALADPSSAAVDAALEVSPDAAIADSLEDLLAADLDGIVIATPSGQHAAQARTALKNGLAVFCQKPLARTTRETYCVINEAREQNRLLAVDFCYRYVHGVAELRRLIGSGALGKLFSIDLAFHNAYGPDKSWACDSKQSGGGCVIDLATHLVDFALWICGDPPARGLSSRLYRGGNLLSPGGQEIEDAAYAEWTFGEETNVRLACSWNYPVGCDAEIRMAFYGSEGAVVFRNLDGSFYDFVVEHHRGPSRERLASPPDQWGGRALAGWVDRLMDDPTYDPEVERCFAVASLIDAIYGR